MSSTEHTGPCSVDVPCGACREDLALLGVTVRRSLTGEYVVSRAGSRIGTYEYRSSNRPGSGLPPAGYWLCGGKQYQTEDECLRAIVRKEGAA